MVRDYLADQREAKPSAVFAARDEGIEDVGGDIRRQARAVVHDLDPERQRGGTVLAQASERTVEESSETYGSGGVSRGFGGIFQKVEKDLKHLVAVDEGGGE